MNIRDTEEEIISAAILIFNEDLSAPLEKVAERAGTTRRTLHRYFKDRRELLDRCEREIRRSCCIALKDAFQSADDPLKKVEHMFHAAVECGSRNTFLHKLHTLHNHIHESANTGCREYENTYQLWKSQLGILQAQGIIDPGLTIDWIHHFFQGIVAATVSARTGEQDQKEIVRLAWISFSRGIGI